MKLSKLILTILLYFVITACAIVQKDVGEQKQHVLWQNHQNNIKNITTFQVSGSLAYFSDKTRHYGRFYINQIAKNEYQLRLTSPVGNLIYSLTITPYLAELTDSSGNKRRDENVERLMSNLTGMEMPLSTLHNWLIGLSDNPANDKLDNEGRLYKTKLLQKGQSWNLTINKYASYKYQNKSIDLPTSLELTKQNERLRLTINDWKL